MALLGGLSWSVSRLCPLPTINQSCSKLAQMLGDSVQIQLWFGSRSHAWLHVGPGLLDRIQPPGLRRALFPSAASPQSPHTCLRLRRVGQPGRIRHRQEPAAPAGSSHFIFPAVPGYGSPPRLAAAAPRACRGDARPHRLRRAEAVKLMTALSCSGLGTDSVLPTSCPAPGVRHGRGDACAELCLQRREAGGGHRTLPGAPGVPRAPQHDGTPAGCWEG